MNKNLFFFILGFLALSLNSFSQIKVNSSGYVGIDNTNPIYQLDVSGDLRVTDGSNGFIYNSGELYPSSTNVKLGRLSNEWDELHAYSAYFHQYTVYSSDKNLKKDIKTLESTKLKLTELRPVKYKFKAVLTGDEEADTKKIKQAEIEQIGFIAQEVQEIFPEIVVANDDGDLGIRYTALIPVLVKSLQEQQAEIDDLKARIEKLEAAKK